MSCPYLHGVVGVAGGSLVGVSRNERGRCNTCESWGLVSGVAGTPAKRSIFGIPLYLKKKKSDKSKPRIFSNCSLPEKPIAKTKNAQTP